MKRAFFLALLMLGCEGRARPDEPAHTEPPKKRGPALAVIDLTGGAPEQEKSSFLAPANGKKSFDELLRITGEMRDGHDESLGVMVKFGGASIGAARAEELGEILAAIKTKKKVYCHADALSNATLMLAEKACSQIWISPAGEVESIGIAAQVIYLRKLLADELHLTIDMLQVGKFKGAEEPLTRDGPSPEARASLTSTLADLRKAWIETLAEGRPAANADVVEDGPWSAPKAKELGLIDEVGYYDEATAALRKESGAVRDRVVFGTGAADDEGGLEEVVRALAGDNEAGGPIALVRATGSISMAGGGGLFGGRDGINERDFDRTITKLERDDDVKAVVVRIDSPGGSALASDLMWHALMKLRKKKPVVFSVGDMAASGGYYLACTGDFIFAEPMSIVGSIGVVGGKIGGGDALERLGVHAETFPANPTRPGAVARVAYESPLVPWDDATRARVLASMTGVYDLFLSRVAEGRSTRGRTISREKVAESAEGRIFGGRTGKERGLVDEIGGLGAALAKARELAKLDASARVAVIGGKGGLFDSLDPTAAEERAMARATSPITLLERIAPDVVPFALSLAPLAEGERTVLAAPFALTVR